ncbi:Sulfate transporter 3.1 [Vigna angularis]|uniref:Sulfate transporter 3.1 n=1 Tax=Phaseolus angularis TaxID=3914 RepID=A0A8T0KTL8_PHAAN|nr:Sulfate transporter 3.1 [Vigna angularis]
MGSVDHEYPLEAESVQQQQHHHQQQQVEVPPPQPFFKSLKISLKETFFPDDPLRQFKNKPPSKKIMLAIQYFFPIFQWAPKYTFNFFKADLIAGITIASLAIPQGISYAKLANLPPILGLYSSFIPPLIYAMMGSSRDLAVGTVAVGSLLMGSMLSDVVNPNEDPQLYLHLAFTATLFAGIFEAALGLFSKKRPRFFWVSAMAPLTSVILGSLFVYFTHAERNGVEVIGELKKGLNPPSVSKLVFVSPYMTTAVKTGIVVGIISLAEGIAVGRSFAMYKNYNIDGNKEMIAMGTMNIVGSFTSCYITTGPFSRSAVNYNAGCKTAASNIIMSIAVMLTLLFLTPLFHYTPLVVLSAIIVSAMLGLIDYEAAIHLWKIDKFDFVVCMSAYIGVVFASVEIGLVIAVAISLLRVLLFIARPRTFVLGNLPNSGIYRNVEHYPNAKHVPGILILAIDAPIYFANAGYLRERITRWVDEEESRIKATEETSLQYVIMDMSGVGNIDTSGISMLEEVKKNTERRELQLVLVNPGSEVMKKLNKSKFQNHLGERWIYLTVEEAVGACNFNLHSRTNMKNDESEGWNNV